MQKQAALLQKKIFFCKKVLTNTKRHTIFALHKNPSAMLKPLTLMAHVLIILSITIVQAQPSLNSSMLCYISADNTSHKVDANLTQAQPYTITCNYDDINATIPKFLQFGCTGGSTLLTVEIHITDGQHNQKITKDIPVDASRKLYEVPVLAFVSNEMMQNGKARINSIIFSNNMNSEVFLSEINFSNISSNYEVKMNQIFTVDLAGAKQKNYFIKANTFKDVNINLYKSNGEFTQKITKSLINGENFIHFDDMPALSQGKYVVVITENDPNSKKSSNSKITVMY